MAFRVPARSQGSGRGRANRGINGKLYNDIGAYLIEKGELDEAIPWFQKAMHAKRYESPAFPHLNLGRVYEKKGDWTEAIASYKQALALNPDYVLAKRSLGRLVSMLN